MPAGELVQECSICIDLNIYARLAQLLDDTNNVIASERLASSEDDSKYAAGDKLVD
jgi:hypothetical protein